MSLVERNSIPLSGSWYSENSSPANKVILWGWPMQYLEDRS
jgi:hypothetical protein